MCEGVASRCTSQLDLQRPGEDTDRSATLHSQPMVGRQEAEVQTGMTSSLSMPRTRSRGLCSSRTVRTLAGRSQSAQLVISPHTSLGFIYSSYRCDTIESNLTTELFWSYVGWTPNHSVHVASSSMTKLTDIVVGTRTCS